MLMRVLLLLLAEKQLLQSILSEELQGKISDGIRMSFRKEEKMKEPIDPKVFLREAELPVRMARRHASIFCNKSYE